MATIKKTIADMTLDELKHIINDTIDERQSELEFPDQNDDENLSWDEIRVFVDQHRVKLPPGAKSSLEILREDRDR